MIRRPGHLVNAQLVLDSAPTLPAIDGFDLALSVDNVVAFGGDATLYRHFLARGLAALETTAGAAVLAVASLAAWRAGVLDVRDDAGERMSDAPPSVVEAALGLEPGELGPFQRGQESNRFAGAYAPEQGRMIAAVGGFRGLGGAFASPPLSAAPLERTGGFAIHTATDDWEYDADVFGGRLTRVDTPGAPGEPSGAELTVSPTSYLVSLVLSP